MRPLPSWGYGCMGGRMKSCGFSGLRGLLFGTLALLVSAEAQAGDCWVQTLENPVTAYGDAPSAARYRGLRQSLFKAEGVLRQDAALNAIPQVRYQAHLFMDKPLHPGAPMAASASVYLHQPKSWAGKCGLQSWADRVHYASLQVSLNTLRAISTQGQVLEGSGFFMAPHQTGQRQGYPLFEGRVLVLTPHGVQPFVPVTVGEYLEAWTRQLQKERGESAAQAREVTDNQEMKSYIRQLKKTDPKTAAELQASLDELERQSAGQRDPGGEWAALQQHKISLTAEQGRQPVFLNAEGVEPYRFGYVSSGAAGARAVVKLNPALWSESGRGARNGATNQAVRVVVLEVYLNHSELFEGEESPESAAALGWLAQVNVEPYRALLGE